MKILGIETSCDETGIAVYDHAQGLLGHAVYSQTDIHAAFGGVVPELASRDHILKIIPMIDQLLGELKLTVSDLHGIAYTAGPGLVGALLVGAMLGQTLAWSLKIPAIPVHHLEGHLLAPCLEEHPPAFPFVALLVSGGHTQLVEVSGLGDYRLLGDTLDDAVGEAFDKTAKLLGLGYPGGALLADLADRGNKDRFYFPRPMVDRPGLDFSFSGLKTYALRMVEEHGLAEQTKADIACAFQEAVVDTLTIKCKRALQKTGLQRLVVAGGVGANRALRQVLQAMVEKHDATVYFPRMEFCTDNGAMIAYVGCLRLLRGDRQTGLGVEVYPRRGLESVV